MPAMRGDDPWSMVVNRRTFMQTVFALACAGALPMVRWVGRRGGRWVEAVRGCDYPGVVKKLAGKSISRPGTWKG